MKRLILLFFAMLVLTGCTALAPTEYVSITDHTGIDSQSGTGDEETAEDYDSLKTAILSFVRNGMTEGTILVTSYDGDVESDLTKAAYEVSKLDPLGAYAVDYMTHDCVRIVSYYEIHIRTTFRRSKAELDAIRSISSDPQLKIQLQLAVEQGSRRLTVRMSDYQEQDIAAMVAAYCAAHPDRVMETPQVAFSVYPDSGATRIVEINFQYTHTAEQLNDMEAAVQESIGAAAEYIRYRQTDRDKAELLFTYLTERFSYTAGDTVTQLYDALCTGVADPEGLAQAWQLICDRAGVSCHTVEGMWAGSPRVWNVISVDGYYRHVDLARCVLELGQLTLWTDEDMTDYYWNTEDVPACEPVPEPPPAEEEAPPAEEEEPPAEEEPPVEEEPPTEEEPPPTEEEQPEE